MEKKLTEIREKLDQIDRSIMESLAGRQQVVREIFDLKAEKEATLRDPEREKRILDKIGTLASEYGLDRSYAEQLFQEIIKHSVRYQAQSLVDHQNIGEKEKRVTVAYQGTDGAFSHRAAMRHFQDRYDTVGCFGYNTFRQAAHAVERGEIDYAILPVENTTAGSINATYDVLGEGNLHIIGEEVLRIVHCLMSAEPVALSNIRRIISHPQALAQCSQFLARLPRCSVESYTDTAMAAKKVMEDQDLSQAAIASAYAAEIYDLHILERDIANQEQNYTRFVVVGRESVSVDLQLKAKTSMVLTTAHKKGALIDCMRIIGDHGINMTKLESRPKLHSPWKYHFYLDVEGNVEEPNFKVALEELRAEADSLTILGCYPEQVSGTYTK